MKSYINSLKTIVYDYENDELPDKSKILKDIKIASKNMIEKIKRFDVKLQTNVYIEINNEHIQVLEGSDEKSKNCIVN